MNHVSNIIRYCIMSLTFKKLRNRLTFITLVFTLLANPVIFSQDKKIPEADKTETAAEPAADKPSEFEMLLDKELSSSGNQAIAKEPESTSWAYQIIKTIIGLAFVIGIILLFRKFLNYKNKFSGNSIGVIKTLYEYPVEAGKRMQIIEVGNKLLLIGVSDAGIQLITEFKEQVFIDQIKLSCDANSRTERPDPWLDLTNLIIQRVQSIFNKNTGKEMESDDHSKWENLQSNARMKVHELREKKKLFEDLDDSDEK